MTVEQATEQVLFERHGAITVIKLNQPEKLNAFNDEMDEAISSYLRSLNRGEYETRCLILTGEGRAFCSGADVGNLAKRAFNEEVQPPWRPYHSEVRALRAMRDCDVPVIGAINGYAVGLGWGLALGTDLRIAGEDARFQVTQLKRGLFADYGLGHFLPQQVGHQRALELMLTARMIDAEEALALGLVLKVVPSEQLLDAAFELAEQIAAGPPLGIAASKRVTYMADNEHLHRNLDWSYVALSPLFGSEDHAEGVRSFMEKRDPTFQGR